MSASIILRNSADEVLPPGFTAISRSFADTPAYCSSYCCGNRRRVEKGANRLTLQERRAVIGDCASGGASGVT